MSISVYEYMGWKAPQAPREMGGLGRLDDFSLFFSDIISHRKSLSAFGGLITLIIDLPAIPKL